ncbi:MAG: divalent-cation tolerance protein CutA [Candidatus Omnitrophota bacterium]
MEKICVIYVTASNEIEAGKIAKELIALRLAACVNVIEQVRSYYRWEGKQENSKEAVLMIKTRESLFFEVEKKIKELHSYSCPAILAIPIDKITGTYADWVVKETKRIT